MQLGKRKLSININLRTYAIIGAILLLWIIFTAATDGFFLSERNLSNLFRQMSIVGVLGTGALLVIVAGGIDLSVGILAGFAGCFGATLMCFHGWSTGATIIAMLAVGTVFGLVQGYVIAYLGVPSFITTLGGQMILKGAILALTKGVTITPINETFLIFGQSYFNVILGWMLGDIVIIALLIRFIQKRKNNVKYHFDNPALGSDIMKWLAGSALIVAFIIVMNGYRGIPVPVFIVLMLALILTFVAEKTTFGRRLYAIGGNVEAVKYSGINVKKNLMAVFVLNGTIAAIAGVILTSRQAAGLASSGMNMELDAIAAAVIGGASMSGGSGRVFGALIGALLMATIDNGMSMLNMDTFWQYIVKGAILVLAVAFDVISKRKSAKC